MLRILPQIIQKDYKNLTKKRVFLSQIDLLQNLWFREKCKFDMKFC